MRGSMRIGEVEELLGVQFGDKTDEAVTTTGARAHVCASLFRPTADTAFAWPPEISGETAGKISQ